MNVDTSFYRLNDLAIVPVGGPGISPAIEAARASEVLGAFRAFDHTPSGRLLICRSHDGETLAVLVTLRGEERRTRLARQFCKDFGHGDFLVVEQYRETQHGRVAKSVDTETMKETEIGRFVVSQTPPGGLTAGFYAYGSPSAWFFVDPLKAKVGAQVDLVA